MNLDDDRFDWLKGFQSALPGSTVDETTNRFFDLGFTFRVVRIDGKPTVCTRDIKRNRVNVEVEDLVISRVVSIG